MKRSAYQKMSRELNPWIIVKTDKTDFSFEENLIRLIAAILRAGLAQVYSVETLSVLSGLLSLLSESKVYIELYPWRSLSS